MATPVSLEPLMTARELAQVTRLALSTIYQKVHEGHIPCVKIGEAVRFRPSEIAAWLDQQAKPGRSSRVPEVQV
jgi:excisionase family DNA binding protein